MTELLSCGFQYRGFDTKERQYLFASVAYAGDVKFILLHEHGLMGTGFYMELSWTLWLKKCIHIRYKKQWIKIMKELVLPSLIPWAKKAHPE